tara:strand:- start:355 stop:1149 length:795 start_codon:yes stop_codon:yes gene_type:complete
MTKAEILDQIIDKKKEELEILKESYKNIKSKRDKRYFQTIKDYFGGSNLSIEGVYLKEPKYGTTFEICRPHPDYTYDKELLTLRLSENWKEGGFKDITTSIYSTSDNSNFELERLITVGEVANLLLDYKDDILGELNAYTEKFSIEYDKAYKALTQCESDITKLRNEKNQTYLDEAANLLNGKGLEFTGNKKGRISLRWDWEIGNIHKARIIRKSLSGKSADIELTFGDGSSSNYDKVRMSNVEDLQWQYRDYVLTNKETLVTN